MDTLNVSERLRQLVAEIFAKGRTIHGRPIAGKNLVVVEGTKHSGRILVPYWFSIWEHGRGKRTKSETTWESFGGVQMSKMQMAIYRWMEKYSLFESRTEKGKINEAKGLTWYINKYGNKHYRSGAYLDIYTSLTTDTVNQLTKETAEIAYNITSDLIQL